MKQVVWLRKLEADAKAQLGTADPNYSGTVYNLAIAYAAVGKYAEAEKHYNKALTIDWQVGIIEFISVSGDVHWAR